MMPLESYEPGTDIRPFLHKIAEPPRKESSRDGGIKVHKIDKGKKNKMNEGLKKALKTSREKALNCGNEMRVFRMDNEVTLNELAAILHCSLKTIMKAETTTGVLTQKQVYKLQPFYGDLVHCFLTVKGDEWKTVQK